MEVQPKAQISLFFLKPSLRLVEEYLNGKYKFGRQDMEMLIEGNDDLENSTTEKEERPLGSVQFEMNLPEHLKGKRPRDMTKEEKKEYNNYRRQAEAEVVPSSSLVEVEVKVWVEVEVEVGVAIKMQLRCNLNII